MPERDPTPDPPSDPGDEKPSGTGKASAKTVPRMGRFRIAGNVVAQLILAIVIFFQLNYVSCQRYDRWDLTQNRKFTLSDTSVNFLGRLDSDVHLVMAFLDPVRRADADGPRLGTSRGA